jgi:hypothetical protein
MESAGSNLPSDVLWTILATSVASLVLLFVGLYFAKKFNDRQQRKGKVKRRRASPPVLQRQKPKRRPLGGKDR